MDYQALAFTHGTRTSYDCCLRWFHSLTCFFPSTNSLGALSGGESRHPDRLSTNFPFIEHPSPAIANDDTNSTQLEENTRYARPEEKATVIEHPADFVTSRRSDAGKFQRLKQGRLDFPRQRRRQTESITSSQLSNVWIPPPDFIGPLDCYEAYQ